MGRDRFLALGGCVFSFSLLGKEGEHSTERAGLSKLTQWEGTDSLNWEGVLSGIPTAGRVCHQVFPLWEGGES